MSLEYILLGMLDRPASGYDLKNEFEEGTRYFWAAELSQIYPTLNRLEERGWLSSRTEASARGPERRVYKRTARGEKELFQWIRSGPAMGTERFAYIGQLIYMSQLKDLDATHEFLTRLRADLAARAQFLRSVHKSVQAIPGFPDSLDGADFHNYMALHIGVETTEARLRACDACLKMVQRRLRKEVSHV